MRRATIQYIRSLKKHLLCTHATKRKLLAQFKPAINNYVDEQPDATWEMLNSAFGTPEEMATTMMQDLPQSELTAFRRQNRLFQALAGSIMFLFISFTIYVFFVKQNSIESYNEAFPSSPTSDSQYTIKEELQ